MLKPFVTRFCLFTGMIIVAVMAMSITARAEQVPVSMQHLSGMNTPQYHHVKSDALKRGFHVYVRLPATYADSNKTYPTIYLLDGGITFPLLGSYYQYLRFGDEVPEMIIVGISYGSDFNFRSTDYTAEAANRNHYGGAPEYQAFLKQVLFPLIETNYKSDAGKRIIFGQSLGGQFVLYSAQTEPDLFWGHIASNPALHRNLPFFLQNHASSETRESKVFVSSGSHDDERFRTPALKWIGHWSEAQKVPWALKAVTLEGENHFSAAPQAFRRAVSWFFESKTP